MEYTKEKVNQYFETDLDNCLFTQTDFCNIISDILRNPKPLKDDIREYFKIREDVMIEITCIECGDKFNKFQGDMDERTCMTCVLKKEDPDVIRPSMLIKERKAK